MVMLIDEKIVGKLYVDLIFAAYLFSIRIRRKKMSNLFFKFISFFFRYLMYKKNNLINNCCANSLYV